MSVVQYDVSDGVATITLSRPESLNSMSNALMVALRESIERVGSDTSVRVVVLTGAGRGFCSGADLAGVAASSPDGGGAPDPIDTMDEVFHPAIRALANCPVPTIARVNGVAAGGGIGLALACDIAIAARSASFVATFGPRLGIVPDMGTTFHLAQLLGPARARAVAMLGGRITAEQAAEWGLIWQVVDDDGLDAAVTAVVGQLARSSPDTMHRIRTSIAAAATNTLSEQLDLERDHQRVLIPRNMAEGAAAFLAKRDPKFDNRRRER
jgi:2-(1,2-epoxy-1,2-dihydrophenyl)acetyl-CoA isomerase